MECSRQYWYEWKELPRVVCCVSYARERRGLYFNQAWMKAAPRAILSAFKVSRPYTDLLLPLSFEGLTASGSKTATIVLQQILVTCFDLYNIRVLASTARRSIHIQPEHRIDA